MLDDKAPVALYYQLKEILIDKIKSNEWSIGSKIPTERELCEMYKVSRTTVRQALNELENTGYLNRKQGKGTFVIAPKMEQRLSYFYSFSEEIRKMGYTPGTRILDFNIVGADKNIAYQLNVSEGTKVYSIKRLRLANGEPFALETSYIPYEACVGLTPDEVSNKGLYNTLKSKYNITPSQAEEVFYAALINGKDAAYLQVKNGFPGLYLERTTYYDDSNKPIEYCKCIIKGDSYKYRVILK